jgi:chromosome segregation ATPase
MTRRNILLLVLSGLIGVGWLAFRRFSNLAYLVNDYSALTGWEALRAGWPVYLLVAGLAALVGLIIGGWAGEIAREREAAAREDEARDRITRADNNAQNATQAAQDTLADQVSKAKDREDQAWQREAAADQAQRDAASQIATTQQRNNALVETNALLQRRLDGALESLERRKRQIRELRKQATDSEALHARIAQLTQEIHEDRQYIIRLESRLKSPH